MLDPDVGHANFQPAPNSLSLPHLTAAIDRVRARIPLGAAGAHPLDSPKTTTIKVSVEAAFAAIDAIVANGA